MSKFVSYLIAVIVLMVGIILVTISAPGGTHTTNVFGGHISTPGNVPLFIVGILLIILSILSRVALIVIRLIKTR